MAAPTFQSPNSEATQPEKRDFRQEVTDRIVKMLEDGVAPERLGLRAIHRKVRLADEILRPLCGTVAYRDADARRDEEFLP